MHPRRMPHPAAGPPGSAAAPPASGGAPLTVGPVVAFTGFAFVLGPMLGVVVGPGVPPPADGGGLGTVVLEVLGAGPLEIVRVTLLLNSTLPRGWTSITVPGAALSGTGSVNTLLKPSLLSAEIALSTGWPT